jgi:hypothetical protein
MKWKNPFAKLDAAGRFSAIVLGAFLIAIACSSSDDGAQKKKKPDPNNPFASYSVKIRAGKDGERFDLPPLKETSFYIPHARLKGGVTRNGVPFPDLPKTELPPKQPSSKPQVKINTPEGGVEIEDDLSTTLGWALVYGAAYECGFGSEPSLSDYPVGQDPVIPPWSGNAFFVFEQDPAACDPQVAYQEAALCIADKLTEIADTPAAVTWSKVPTSPTISGMPPGPWQIPPQASIDRFIARDVAMHTLAIIGYTDLLAHDSPPGATNPTRTCAQAYGEAAALASTSPSAPVLANYYTTVFGVPESDPALYFPPTGDNRMELSNFEGFARTRMLFNAHVLRAAARLLRDQIPKAVYADLAGGERQRAKATDPLRGAKLMWGAETDADRPYNSLAHVTRVISGRWERGDLETDPQFPCGGIEPLNLLKEGLGPEFSARYSDRVVTNKDQEIAAKLVDQSGVVLDESVILTESIATIRGAIQDQLVANAAAIHGVSPTDADFIGWGEGKAIVEMLGKVADEDLRFGLLSSLSGYKQLATSLGPGTRTGPGDPGGGLSASSTVMAIEALDGFSLDGGIPRRDLTAPITARVGGVQTANQCMESENMDGPMTADGGALAAFQDAFYIGETYKKRLIALREEAKLVFDESDDAVTVPSAAAVEVRTWAGEGRMVLGANAPSGNFDNMHLMLVGFNPADFGVATAADMVDEIVLVTGPPWVADCAAGVRTSCPEDFDDDYLARPTSYTVLSDDPSDPSPFGPSWSRVVGADGTILELVFEPVNWPNEFVPQVVGAATPTHQLYVVARHSPKAISPKGRVLGAIAVRADGGHTTTMVSTYKHDLQDDTTGVRKRHPENAHNPDGVTTSTPPGYCIEGIPRKPFVPLENELTSDADPYENSWRHYIELAKQAALRADELGKELISLGLDRDYRAEAAGEDLAQICGDYTALEKIPINKPEGTIGESLDDQSLNACLNEDRVDVVLLTTAPKELAALSDTGDQADWIKANVLKCPPTNPDTDNPLCEKSELRWEALGLAEYDDLGLATAHDCDDAVALPRSVLVPGGFNGESLKQMAVSNWLSEPSLLAGLSQARLEIREDGNWGLLVGGARVMDSEIAGYWPRCTADSGVDSCEWSPSPGADANPLSIRFDKIFRPDLFAYNPDTASHKMLMLWRVQGALWMLGGLAGEVPEGMISGYVPAARVDLGTGSWGSTPTVPIPTVYGEGRWVLVDSPTLTYRLDYPQSGAYELTASDVSTIGDVRWINANFDLSLTTASSVVQGIYDDPGMYFHVPTINARSSSRESHSSDYKNYNKSDPTKRIKTGQLGTWLKARGQEFSGMNCAQMSGHASNANQWHAKSLEWTALAKLSDSVSKPYSDGGFPSWAFSVAGPVWGAQNPNHRRFITNGISACSSDLLEDTNSAYYMGADTATCILAPNTTQEKKAANLRRPTAVPPSERMLVFLNSYLPEEECRAGVELGQAVALGCLFSGKGALPIPTEPPAITVIGDLPKLDAWVGVMERFSKNALSRLYLQGIPDRVIADFKTGSVGSGALKGKHGQLVLELEAAITSLAGGWPQVASRLAQLRSALEYARLNIDMTKIENQIASKQLAISRWQVHSKIAHSIANGISSFGIKESFNPVGGAAQAAASLVDLKIAQQELEALGQIEGLQTELKDNKLDQVLNQLQTTTTTLYADIYTGLSELRQSTSAAAQTSEALRMSEVDAQYQAAKGAGANFLKLGDDEIVKFPVNTVLNHQYDITRKRYEAALLEARYLAYVARIAVEQRLGAGLDTFTNSFGPLEPPAQWADDVCSLNGVDYAGGVDYEKLSDPFVEAGVAPDGGVDPLAQFSDMFVGDYVDKLEKFVEFYNMEYPSHDGDDIAILSVRDDLIGPGGVCITESPNILLYSSDLTKSHLTSDDAQTEIVNGWVRRACTAQDAFCLRLGTPAVLDPVPDPPVAGPASGSTWLYEIASSSVTDELELDEITAQVPPAGIVEQSAVLAPSSYTLSWWDQGRDADGEPAASIPYPVTVYDDQWQAVETKVFTPWDPTTGDDWSKDRQELHFTITTAGTYHVAFAAAIAGTGPGSVVIANVQLEKGATSGPYWANGSTRMAFDTACAAGDPAAFRASFTHNCTLSSGSDVCYYELNAPFSLDTFGLDEPIGTQLGGKIAAQNFNYRHITVALNVVGSGVVDCAFEPTAACFGSAYVEYTLDHNAFDVEVLSHKQPKEAQHFNFGLGSINYAKALAAERFITLPIGSGDSALLAQPAFEKTEFRGRPLEGSYRLRVFDKPSLNWSQVEDIQIVLKYHYWSRIQAQPSRR